MKKRLLMLLIAGLMIVGLTACKEKSRFKLGEYKGLTYKNKTIEVTEEDLDALLTSLHNSYLTYETLEERKETPVQKGDVVNIDYVGVLEGQTEPFSGGSANGKHLEIGANEFVPGFEDGLIGARVGDTVKVNLTFPEQYYPEFAGKNVVFTVKINAIEKKVLPELNDSLISDYTEGKITTIQAYKEYAKEYLQASREASFKTEVKGELLDKIVASSTFDKLDQKKVDDCYQDLLKYYNSLASQSNMSLEDYVKESGYTKSLQEFYAEMKASAEDTVKQEIVLEEIISKEKISLTEENYNSMIEVYMSRYGYKDKAKFEQDYTVERIRKSMLYDLALKVIFDNAVAE